MACARHGTVRGAAATVAGKCGHQRLPGEQAQARTFHLVGQLPKQSKALLESTQDPPVKDVCLLTRRVGQPAGLQ